MNKTQKLTLTSMLLCLIIVIAIFEGMLPAIPFMPPGVSLGLSNTVIMYSLFFIAKKNAIFLTIVKSAFVFITRGATSSILSLSGGISSIIIMTLLILIFKEKISYIILSIFGAIFHNIGQLIAITFILGNFYIIYYLPVLLIFGIIMGTITGILLKFIMPAFNFFSKKC